MNTRELQVGDEVFWWHCEEIGYVTAVTPEAIEVQWQLSGRQWYSVYCGAYSLIESIKERFSCRYKR